MKENLKEKRAVDTVGRPRVGASAFGRKGGETGSSRKENAGGSAKGVGGGLVSASTKDEPVFHEAAYRAGRDNNFEKNPQSGVPKRVAGYRGRDRQGSGLEVQPKYQNKLRNYPKSGPQTKKSNNQDA